MQLIINTYGLDCFGNPYGRIWHSKLGSTTLIRRRQLEMAEVEPGLRLAVEWVGRKLENPAKDEFNCLLNYSYKRVIH